ncbi:unnamed protein product [Cylicocyclus nassatus]|uniref:Inosine/uridine-preferring nucleoside hydrolase domain-containing protein n=1 Tax=Cylicocyclus nassatus TaxID=53992 RepID=A0AA36MER8_CYLNA|nr:unnamed protein product [Cylicocyclus nassatus]
MRRLFERIHKPNLVPYRHLNRLATTFSQQFHRNLSYHSLHMLTNACCVFLVILLLCPLLTVSTFRHTQLPSKKQLIIDTDGFSDDIRAISLALQHPDVEVLAFTTVHGCVSVEQATANVARCQRANALANPIPIYKGASESLLNKESNRNEISDDGLGDQPQAFPVLLGSDFVPTSEEVAATALVRLSREHPEATLVCLGPLTNVAIALKIDPRFTFDKVFIMGGNYQGIGNVASNSSSEINFHGDPEAASIVVSKLAEKIVMIPWEVFFIEGVKHEKLVDFDAHLRYDTNLASFLSTATSKVRTAMAKSNRQNSYCDEIAVAAAIDMNRVARKLMHLRIEVELFGAYTRGQVVVDWMDVVWSKDDAEFVAIYGETLRGRLSPITFIVSYDVVLVDEWIHKAVKGDPGPW